MSDNGAAGLPRGGVRSVLSLGVLAVAAALAGVLLVREPGSDVTQMVIGGWIAALGNVVGYYFGSRSGAGPDGVASINMPSGPASSGSGHRAC